MSHAKVHLWDFIKKQNCIKYRDFLSSYATVVFKETLIREFSLASTCSFCRVHIFHCLVALW